MVKILRIINRFNLGGITYNVSYLSKYMPNSYETILVGGPEEKSEKSSLFIPQSLGLQPIIVPSMRRSINPFNDIKSFFALRKLIKQHRPDIVHTHASKAGALGRLAAKSCGVKIIVHTFHGHVFNGYFSPAKTFLLKLFERRLAKYSSVIIAISQKQKNDLALQHKICNLNKIQIISLGLDLNKFQEKKTEKRNAFRNYFALNDSDIAVVIVGRLAPIKNHFLFIDAINFVRTQGNKNVKGLIVGDGETKVALMQYCKNSNISYTSDANNSEAGIKFCGWREDVDVVFAGSDIVALTSNNEGTPVSLIEAQAAQKFIVTTNAGGVSDILENNSGFVSETGDVTSYKQNLLKAVLNINVLNNNLEKVSKSIVKKFDYKRLCSDMNLLYKSLLSKD
ncbi:MAG: glycosyltransferase [Bacteroidetes bacterium]|nr:glycosyltransferase [Bacteroidota bacterium]